MGWMLKVDEFYVGIWRSVESGANLTLAFREVVVGEEGIAH